MVLVLGSRTSGLFGNEHMHSLLAGFSPQRFDNLSNIERFRKCYHILERRFNEKEIYHLLNLSLNAVKYREEDERLAGLVKNQFFDTVITTNIDTLLEDAFILWGMEKEDYRVLLHGRDDVREIINDKIEVKYGKIIKIFGDVEARQYKTVQNVFDLNADQILKSYLENMLAEDVLVIGYDPIWDQPIEHAFLKEGKTFWFVNEELPEKKSHMARVLEERKGRYLVGVQGKYSNFLNILYDHIEIEKGISSRGTGLMVYPSSALSTNPQRKKAFISYCHTDKRHLERLQIHLKPFLRSSNDKLEEEALVVWDDTYLKAGEHWNSEIEKALASARVAILLISADFLASDFIMDYEVPCLLDAAQKGEVTLISVILRPCAFDATHLYEYQTLNDPSQPLTRMNEDEQEVIWNKLAKRIYDILIGRKE